MAKAQRADKLSRRRSAKRKGATEARTATELQTAAAALGDADVLQRVLELAGGGQFLFLGPVGKLWLELYSQLHAGVRVRLYSSRAEGDQEYIVCNNIQTLIWLAQLADIEMHASMARISPEPDAHDVPLTFAGSEENLERSLLNYPDYLVFDLDPYIYAGSATCCGSCGCRRSSRRPARRGCISTCRCCASTPMVRSAPPRTPSDGTCCRCIRTT